VAVIEGWDDPGIATYMHNQDLKYGLPDPDIETIYPSGSLPAQCPAGMVALASYGSCNGWVGELRLDVLTVHLIAPYAVISELAVADDLAAGRLTEVRAPELDLRRTLRVIWAGAANPARRPGPGPGRAHRQPGDLAGPEWLLMSSVVVLDNHWSRRAAGP
jgi:hypothetical protein